MVRKNNRKGLEENISESSFIVDASSKLTPRDLKENLFFKGLSEEEIGEMMKVCTVNALLPGECAVREKDVSRDLFVVLSGKLRISKTLYAGDEKDIGFLAAGEFFGEMAFLDGGPRSANVSCLEETMLLRIDRIAFEKLAVARPGIAYKVAMKIAGTLAQRLRISNDMVEGFFSNPNKAILEFKTRLLKIQTMLQMM